MIPNDASETRTRLEEKTVNRMAFAALSAIAVNALFLVGAGLVFRQYPLLLVDPARYISVRLLASVPPRTSSKPEKVAKPPTLVATQPGPVRQTAPPQAIASPTPMPVSTLAPVRAARPRPEKVSTPDAHNRVLTAKSDEVPEHTDSETKPEGNARTGQVIARQGEGSENTSLLPPASAGTDGGGGSPVPLSSASPLPQPSTIPSPVAGPVGPTQDARAIHEELPRIPASLNARGYQSFVRVVVDIKADGSFTAIVKTSCGSPDIDDLVLLAMKRWKWEPALKDGSPVASSQIIRVTYEVN